MEKKKWIKFTKYIKMVSRSHHRLSVHQFEKKKSNVLLNFLQYFSILYVLRLYSSKLETTRYMSFSSIFYETFIRGSLYLFYCHTNSRRLVTNSIRILSNNRVFYLTALTSGSGISPIFAIRVSTFLIFISENRHDRLIFQLRVDSYSHQPQYLRVQQTQLLVFKHVMGSVIHDIVHSFLCLFLFLFFF